MHIRKSTAKVYKLLPFIISNNKYIRIKLPNVEPGETLGAPRELQSGNLLGWGILHSGGSSLRLSNYKKATNQKKK